MNGKQTNQTKIVSISFQTSPRNVVPDFYSLLRQQTLENGELNSSNCEFKKCEIKIIEMVRKEKSVDIKVQSRAKCSIKSMRNDYYSES